MMHVVPTGSETILVVDDEPVVLEINVALLKSLGYNVKGARSGEDAIAYLEKYNADLVLLDIMMSPGIDGVETLCRIKAMNPAQKAVVLSGSGHSCYAAAMLALGAGCVVHKPVGLPTLAKAVRTELDGSPHSDNYKSV
jgi:two-component system, cell cycle sensor histidine kinase and response regulator CckA